MIKSKLSERDICTKYITPAITNAGWNENPHHFREEVYFTAGRIKVRGKLVSRGKGKRADYILYYKPNQPIAVVEAKDNAHSIGAGIQQGLEYAEILDYPLPIVPMAMDLSSTIKQREKKKNSRCMNSPHRRNYGIG